MNYGKALRIARAASGMEQKELAAKAKLNPSFISLIEKGARQPSTRAITKMCRALQIPEPLFTMLAAEPEDLAGIDKQEFEQIGTYLAKFLIRHEPSSKHRKLRVAS
jgi:transcriptional regulator with XRE-family HTH domain